MMHSADHGRTTERYGVTTGDDWWFDVVVSWRLEASDMVFPTKLEALEAHLRLLEREREALNASIARAKRLRRAWRQKAGPAR